MRKLARRGMAVALAAGFMTMLAATAAMAQTTGITTHTTLATETQQMNGRTVTTYSATVVGEDGTPATGGVTLMEHGRSLAGAALSSTGTAEIRFDGLAAGDHGLSAIYGGDSTHAASQSEDVMVNAATSTPPGFSLAIVPATTMTIAAPGDAGSLVATITPTGGFTGFISLSCSGSPASAGAAGGSALPVGVSCVFTPANLQITSTAALKADMSLQTLPGQTTPTGLHLRNHQPTGARGPLVLAVLLPGVIGLGFLGRKRKLMGRLALLMVGAITLLGTTSCAARYKYLNHGPTFSGTPTGTFTLTVTAQTSNGVTAASQSQTLNVVVN